MQNDPLAWYELSRLHIMARGRVIDWRESVRCLELAAAGGYAVAQFDLATHYLSGTPVHPQDLPRALALYHLANDQVRTVLETCKLRLLCRTTPP